MLDPAKIAKHEFDNLTPLLESLIDLRKELLKGSRITLTIKAANWVIIEVNNTLTGLLGTVNCPWQYWTILLNTQTWMFPRILNINKIGSWHPVTPGPWSTIENSPIRSHTERLIDTLEQLTGDEDLPLDNIITKKSSRIIIMPRRSSNKAKYCNMTC